MSLVKYEPADIVFDSVVELEDASADGFASLLYEAPTPSMLFVFEHTIHAIALTAKIPEGWVDPITERDQAGERFFSQVGEAARMLVFRGMEHVLAQYAEERLHYFSHLHTILAPVLGRPDLRIRSGRSISAATRRTIAQEWTDNRSVFGGQILELADGLQALIAQNRSWSPGPVAAPPEPELQQLALDVAGLEAAFARAGSFRSFWPKLPRSVREGIVQELVDGERSDPAIDAYAGATHAPLGSIQCQACGHTVRIRGYPVQGVVSTLSVADCDRDRGTHDVVVQWSAHRG